MERIRDTSGVLVRKTRMEQTTWKNNIKLNVKEIECEDVDWIYVAQDRI
jgi:hypothetical protein